MSVFLSFSCTCAHIHIEGLTQATYIRFSAVKITSDLPLDHCSNSYQRLSVLTAHTTMWPANVATLYLLSFSFSQTDFEEKLNLLCTVKTGSSPLPSQEMHDMKHILNIICLKLLQLNTSQYRLKLNYFCTTVRGLGEL